MWRKIREEWRRRDKKNEDEDKEADDENWMIKRKNDVIIYIILWECAGFREVF